MHKPANQSADQAVNQTVNLAINHTVKYPELKKGIVFALLAYLIWGIAPLYFKLLGDVPAEEIIAYRIIWSCLFMFLLVTLMKAWRETKFLFRHPKKLILLFIAAYLIGINWYIFIWAINHQHVLETSLGYFINPLFNILIGTVFLGERLRRLQWIAVAITFLAVAYQIWLLHTIPMIALSLAITFSIYGLLKKKVGVDARIGMLFETLFLLPIALIYMFFISDNAIANFQAYSFETLLLLSAAGVITTTPLIFFTAAATRLPLAYLGFFQYISPSLNFIFAITIFNESINFASLLTFLFIWFAIGLIVFDSLKQKK